jgi:uncharacterized cupredoxin-like copper-binding protein
MFRRSTFGAVSALASSAVLLVAGASVAEASVHAHAVKAHAAATTVTVAASEYKFKLSTQTASKPGPVTFKITNKGKETHDFSIDGHTSKMLSPGKSTTLTVTLKKGANKYLCTVPGHAQLGMKGTFTVK